MLLKVDVDSWNKAWSDCSHVVGVTPFAFEQIRKAVASVMLIDKPQNVQDTGEQPKE